MIMFMYMSSGGMYNYQNVFHTTCEALHHIELMEPVAPIDQMLIISLTFGKQNKVF